MNQIIRLAMRMLVLQASRKIIPLILSFFASRKAMNADKSNVSQRHEVEAKSEQLGTAKQQRATQRRLKQQMRSINRLR